MAKSILNYLKLLEIIFNNGMIDYAKIKKLDPQNVFSSIKYLPNQIEQTINDVQAIKFPQNYQKSEIIVISGMGGSIYNYYVINSFFYDSLKIPCLMVNGYSLPASVDYHTLFIGSSYSGSTEETIFSTQEAIRNKSLVTAVTSGSKLAELMKKNNLPFYQFAPKFNPCGQPRIGLGYTIFGPILILTKLNYIRLNISALRKSISVLKINDRDIQKKADQIKDKLKEKIVIFVGAEHLAGNVHIVRNQLNETAKSFAEYHLIPELNHHLMEGLTYPKNKRMIFIFYNSNYYDERNSKRMEVTKKILKKQNIDYLDIPFAAKDKMEEFLFYLQFGSYLSFLLGIDYGVNPSLIPWVDYFKKQLKKGV
jgi:glucose/mannose-6-phosphate isomerase